MKARQVLLGFSNTGTGRASSKKLFRLIRDQQGMGAHIISSLSIDPEALTKRISLSDLVKQAYVEAMQLKQPYVGSEHLLLALLKFNNSDIYSVAQKSVGTLLLFPSALANESTSALPATLGEYATNLNLAVASDTALSYVDRPVLDTLISTLLQKKDPNPLLIGPPGVGKRSLVKLLALRLNALDVPTKLLGYLIYEVDLLSLMTSNAGKSNIEQVLSSFFSEILKQERIIIYLKNFNSLFFSTGAGLAVPLIYSSFKSRLQEHHIRFIATSTSQMFSRLASDNPQVLSGFRTVEVAEPDSDLMPKILEVNAEYLGAFHGVRYTPSILKYLYERTHSLESPVKLPQRAVDILDRAGASVLLRKAVVPEAYKTLLETSAQLNRGLEQSVVTQDYENALEIRKVLRSLDDEMLSEEKRMFAPQVFRVTRADVDTAVDEYLKQQDTKQADASKTPSIRVLTSLESRLARRIIGQNEAISLVSRALVRTSLGLRPGNRPLGGFLFLGPTGVGKTELAKVLAEEFFGPDSLIRLDMSDFGEKHTVARLVGAPPGYIGYGEGGELTRRIAKKPASLVLFDEIEKAHPDVLNILLQILEEGELVDAQGTPFDFSKSLIILTSNLGTEIVHKPGIGFDVENLDFSSLESRLRSNLKRILKPELLNRLDDVVVFHPLSKDAQFQILELLLQEIKLHLNKQNVHLRISDKAKRYLLDLGFSREYGARSLRRLLEKRLLDPIASVLLEEKSRPLRLSAVMRDDSLQIKVLPN